MLKSEEELNQRLLDEEEWARFGKEALGIEPVDIESQARSVCYHAVDILEAIKNKMEVLYYEVEIPQDILQGCGSYYRDGYLDGHSAALNEYVHALRDFLEKDYGY